jgi:phosphotransferase system enzyme I (PtsI)
MSTHFRGAGGAPGIALGRASIYTIEETPVQATDANPEAALERFAIAQSAAAAALRALAEQFRAEGKDEEAGIFDAQALLIEDDFVSDEVARQVRDEGAALESALDATISQMRAAIEALDDEYLRARAADMDAVGQIIRAQLRGSHAHGTSILANLPQGAILIAADLTPMETATLRNGAVAGFATAYGGPTGHTAILARSLGIPATVGLGADILTISDNTELILDGDAALLIAAPDKAERVRYTQRADEQRAAHTRRQSLRDQAGRLADGYPISLWANIGSPSETQQALAHGAEGIGLFRTEFLFLDRDTPPSEDEQYTAYREVLEAMAGRPVVIRTIDIGGDKLIPYLQQPPEANPFLGVRGLRLCMQRPDLFQTQLRALLRASMHGNLWVMLPMVATPEDFAFGREQLRIAAATLTDTGVEHRDNVPLGVMIETPAAAITADLLAREAAFFSVGSNDLTQYTMAADRGLADLATRYPHDAPAVFRLIERAAEAAKRAVIPIGVCGELAAVPDAAVVLAGLGIAELSMAPAAIPIIKERLRETTLAEAQAVARTELG